MGLYFPCFSLIAGLILATSTGIRAADSSDEHKRISFCQAALSELRYMRDEHQESTDMVGHIQNFLGQVSQYDPKKHLRQIEQYLSDYLYNEKFRRSQLMQAPYYHIPSLNIVFDNNQMIVRYAALINTPNKTQNVINMFSDFFNAYGFFLKRSPLFFELSEDDMHFQPIANSLIIFDKSNFRSVLNFTILISRVAEEDKEKKTLANTVIGLARSYFNFFALSQDAISITEPEFNKFISKITNLLEIYLPDNDELITYIKYLFNPQSNNDPRIDTVKLDRLRQRYNASLEKPQQGFEQ